MRQPYVRQPCASSLGPFADLTELGFSVDLGDHSSNTLQWSKVNVTAGTKVLISVMDDKEQEGWSGVVSSGNVSIPIYFLISCLSRSPSSRATIVLA